MKKTTFLTFFIIFFSIFIIISINLSHSHPHEDKKAAMGYVDLSERERLQRLNYSYGEVIDPGIFKLNKINSNRLVNKQIDNPNYRAVTDRFGYPVKDTYGKVLLNPNGETWGIEYQKALKAAKTEDYETALAYLLPLSVKGIDTAFYTLGVLYFHGLGVSQSYKKAEELFLKISNEGIKHYYHLGYIYGFSEDESFLDYEKAEKFIRMSAEGGYEEAQYILGYFYYNGLGLNQDLIKADMWFNLAEANGNEQASEARDILLDYISISELKKAAELAQKCFNNYFQKC